MPDQNTINAHAEYAYGAVTANGVIDTRLDTVEARVTATTDSRAQYSYSQIVGEDGLLAQVFELNGQVGILNAQVADLTARLDALS
jgi:hypothetical protein